MRETIRGTYKTTHWHEQEYSPVEHGPRLAVAEKELSLMGGVQGQGTLRYSVVYLGDGSNHFSGHVRLSGRFGAREGSVVIEDSGAGNGDRASGTWKIVAGSASGGLAGLTGDGAWTWEKGSEQVAYTLSYEL